MYTRVMPRLEDVLADLAALPGARAAALAGFDGLIVDEAFAPGRPAARRASVADGDVGAADALISDSSVPDALMVAPPGGPGMSALDGAVVELTHAWNGVRRACADYLAGGAARELLVVAEGGALVAQVVAGAWFVFLWTTPEADLEHARAAVRDAASGLAEVVG